MADPRPLPAEVDVVVVGAGSAGCPLAARLADAGREVLLLEAGADHARRRDFPPELRDGATLRGAVPGASSTWVVPAELIGSVTRPVARGRVVGGSSAVNGGYFVRGTPADFDGWGLAEWSWARVLPAFRRLEADREYGRSPGHGADGPVPVTRPAPGYPPAEAFAAAAAELGFPAEPDKNGGGPPGCGPLPSNVVEGVRINTAMAYLSPRRAAPGLTVRGGVVVRRVLVERGRAVGVETDAGQVRAAEVVLSAGAVGSPQVLLLSGIGPAAALRRLGIPVLADLPGVGEGFSDHPSVQVPWRPVPGLPAPPGPPLEQVLHAAPPGAPGGVEVLPWFRPFGALLPRDPPGDDVLNLGVTLLQPVSRGRLTLVAADPARPPRLVYGYLASDADRAGMRAGVRLAAELLRTRALAPLTAPDAGPPGDELTAAVLGADRALDAWIGRHLGTAVHLSGSARMGSASDAGAVVDERLRVRGVAGLRVADTSVLPRVPSRGTAATAVMIGERAAELMAATRSGAGRRDAGSGEVSGWR